MQGKTRAYAAIDAIHARDARYQSIGEGTCVQNRVGWIDRLKGGRQILGDNGIAADHHRHGDNAHGDGDDHEDRASGVAQNVTQDFAMRVSFGQEITVGSRAISAEAEKATPVDVIPQEMIRTAPSTETSQIIQKMAPSFNFPRPTITDGTDTVRPATLRGLGPDQLLVMINGNRVNERAD